ncbi:MAG: tail fiber domain-containing protein [Phycisphaeraceae bacterium]|nr:MAG: tail fiber domain-containing protein [Phycisphaeraceae bacterium]
MTRRNSILAVLAALGLACQASPAQTDATLSYQGRLLDNGAAFDGTVSAIFTLWDASTGGAQIGPTNAEAVLPVADGLLTATLDFGPDAYNGDRWLEITVNGSTLSPRQKLAAAPRAVRLEGVSNDPTGYFGVNTLAPLARWHVEEATGHAIYGESLADDAIVGVSSGGGRAALLGIATGSSGDGVIGRSEATGGTGVGVYGSSASTSLSSAGVSGYASATSGNGNGVLGRTLATGSLAAGVYGRADSDTGGAAGGRFTTQSSGNGSSGVFAQAYSEAGNTFGVQAIVSSPYGTAVSGRVNAASGGTAVIGINGNADGYAGYFDGRTHMTGHATVGRAGVQATGAEWFGVHTTAGDNEYGGMYVSGNNSGSLPFYGYSPTGSGGYAWHYYDGGTSRWYLVVNYYYPLTADGSNGYVGIGDTSPDYPLDMGSGAHCTTGGVWTNASSREWKQGFQPVDVRDVLKRVDALPITEWSYKAEDGVRHMGPVAEDFAEAFGLGDDVQTIGTVDADGVALAAIQGLHQIIEEKDTRIEALERRVEALEALLTSSRSADQEARR